ncbi:MAG: glycosyltransferase family 2 protein [Muribaculaceae bacterium]|nr:glycosyltransferase family 2 protein [Muribaculaceae bacterium]
MKNPRITVIITSYNPGDYLNEAIESIVNQSIFQWIELIVVNDGSEDRFTDTFEKLREKYNDCDRISILNKAHGGLGAARNFGIDNAKGEYLMFCDDDDIYHSRAAETLLTMLESANADMATGALTTSLEKLNADGNVSVISGREATISSLHKTSSIHNSSSSVLFCKELFNFQRYPEGILYEDLACNPRVMLRSNNVAVTDAPLYFYRQRKGSIIHSFKPERVSVLDITAELVKDFSSDSELKQAAIDRHFGAACNILTLTYKAKTTGVFTAKELQTLRRRCRMIIREHRKLVLGRSDSRPLNRLGALLSYLFI